MSASSLHPVSTRALSKSFGTVTALDNVTFDVGSGVTAILGPNGAGKTTLLRILATAERPSSGSFEVFGTEPGVSPARLKEARRIIGYMPQDSDLSGGLRVGSVLSYVALLKEQSNRIRAQEVERVLGIVDLTGQARARVKSLSGGMRRRLLLAQALVGRPRLLLLDEPTAGLDPAQRSRFRSMISELAASSTMLVSTHQTEDLPDLCRRVLVVDRGSVRFQGSLDELMEFARGRVWVSSSRPDHVWHSWRSPDGRYRNLFHSVPEGVRSEDPTLEEGYLALVGEATQ